MDKAHALAEQRRWKEAVDAYKDVLRAYPHSYEAAWGIARIYCHEVHHHHGCLEWTEKLLEGYPNEARYKRARATGLRDRAASYRSSGEPDLAAADEAAADALFPN